MPWHCVQFLRITCHTGPSGRSTFGRVAPRFCAAAGAAMKAAKAAMRTTRAANTAALSNIRFIEISPASNKSRQTPGAVTETIPVDAIQIEDAQQHVGTPLHVVGKDNVTIPFERSID